MTCASRLQVTKESTKEVSSTHIARTYLEAMGPPPSYVETIAKIPPPIYDFRSVPMTNFVAPPSPTSPYTIMPEEEEELRGPAERVPLLRPSASVRFV